MMQVAPGGVCVAAGGGGDGGGMAVVRATAGRPWRPSGGATRQRAQDQDLTLTLT